MFRASRSKLTAGAVALGLMWWPIGGWAAPPRDKQREDLMDQLGLPKQKPKPKPDESPSETPSEPDTEPDTTPDTAPDQPNAPGGGSSPDAAKPKARVTYSGRIRKQLDADCKSCHGSGAMAGNTRFVISGDLDVDYRGAKRLVDTQKPATSVLLSKAAGQNHAGGTNYPKGSAKYTSLLQWIEDGAVKGGGSSSAPAPAPAPTPAPTPEAPQPEGGKPKPKQKPKPDAPTTTTTEPEPEPAASWVEPGPAVIVYDPTIHQLVQDRCNACHAAGSFAGNGALGLTGDPARDYPTVRALVSLEQPDASALLVKARGENHGGGASLDPAGAEYQQLLAWIEAGALHDQPSATTESSEQQPVEVEVDATTSASPKVEPGARLGDGTPVPEAASPNRLPFSLPYHLRLNGRFDLSYERRDYKNHPFGPGRNALQTYHHFLFLSRSGAKDPFGFNIELLTQQFYEFNARFVTDNRRAKFLIKAGKILVPFGDEPLYHTSYGGRTGFDQQLMPTVWSQPGLDINAHIQLGPVSLSNDLYAVQGYGLRSADAVLNLQSDFSSFDDFKFAVGDRIGLSWAPLTAWYSLQINPLGFDRRLFMQAFDFEFWRLNNVPFLQDLVVGFGAMRADVSGGGPGNDYYHFGSYGKIRYYPIDWLYLQYRWGLKTFDNRRKLYYDDTRADERDGSSHNLTIGATYMGFFAAVQLFWNLEKTNEQDDDFLRITVGYAF